MKKSTTKKRPSSAGVPASRDFHAVLVPVDLLPSTDRVLGRLLRLPLADDARVTLLHVVPGSLSPGEQRRAKRDASKALAEEVRHLRAQIHRRIRITPVVRLGAAAKEIAACATEVQAELIVMGRGGGGALRDAVLGSTAERVVRRSQRPVLVVRLAPRATYRRPALAIDLDQAAHQVVRLALRVLPPPRPRIEVIHAFVAPYEGLVYPSLTRYEVEERMDELRASATDQLGALLATAVANARLRSEDDPSWKTHVWHGSPRIVVEKAMTKLETDLLVLGTHGHTGAAFVFLGTVAGDLLRTARCDVLVVPPAAPST